MRRVHAAQPRHVEVIAQPPAPQIGLAVEIGQRILVILRPAAIISGAEQIGGEIGPLLRLGGRSGGERPDEGAAGKQCERFHGHNSPIRASEGPAPGPTDRRSRW